MRGGASIGTLIVGAIVAAAAIFVGVGLSQGWFNNDDYGDTVHPAGAFWSFTIPKHFINGGYGGGQHSNYSGPGEGPDYAYIALNGAVWDTIRVEVVHGQSVVPAADLLGRVRTAARAQLAGGQQASGFRATTVGRRPAVSWQAMTRTDSGYPLGQLRTYIPHGTDAVLIICQWRSDQDKGPLIARGCRAVQSNFRFTG